MTQAGWLFTGEEERDTGVSPEAGTKAPPRAAAMKQTVYKVERGDLVGPVNGENLTIVLLQGSIKGNINAEKGEIFLARGSISGDVRADKVVCPSGPSQRTGYGAGDDLPDAGPGLHVKCVNCAFAKKQRSLTDDTQDYGCLVSEDAVERNGLVPRVCGRFMPKTTTCRSCSHCYIGVGEEHCCTVTGKAKKLGDIHDAYKCRFYDGVEGPPPRGSDCLRFSNDIIGCSVFRTKDCTVTNCPHWIARADDF